MVSNREMTIHFLSSQKNSIISKWKDELLHLPDGYLGYFKGEVENIFNLLMEQVGKSDTDIDDVLKVVGKKLRLIALLSNWIWKISFPLQPSGDPSS